MKKILSIVACFAFITGALTINVHACCVVPDFTPITEPVPPQSYRENKCNLLAFNPYTGGYDRVHYFEIVQPNGDVTCQYLPYEPQKPVYAQDIYCPPETPLVPPIPPTYPVPEPATLTLMGLGLAGGFMGRKRLQK